jgi:hypothetical protein
MIVSLRGTSGSGKSFVSFSFLKKFPNTKILDDNGKVLGYKIEAGLDKPLFIVGKYETACGGCDSIHTQQEAADRAILYSKTGHVLMEGLLASAAGPNGAVTKTIHDTGEAVFAILNTPLATCLERVQMRRDARGDERPLNPKNTKDKWQQTMQTARAMSEDGYTVVAIDHTNSFEEVFSVFKNGVA